MQNVELQMLQSTKQDLKWLNEHYSTILGRFNNQFVAIKGQQPIASAATLDELLKDLRKRKINPVSALIKFISRESMIL